MTTRIKLSPWHQGVFIVVIALTLLVGLGEGLARVLDRDGESLSREEVLQRLAEEPDFLINLDPSDFPATSDVALLGNRATPALVNCLVHNLDRYARQNCVFNLIATRDSRAIEPLIIALDDPDDGVQGLAVKALSRIEARPATPRLIAFLKEDDTDEYFRHRVASALGRSGDPDALTPLIDYYNTTLEGRPQSALWDMRRQLTQGQLEDFVIRPFSVAYHPDKDQRQSVGGDVFRFAVERAGDLKITAATPFLIQHYRNASSSLRNRIIYNLGRIGDPSAVPFLQGLVDTKGEARLLNNTIFALQRLGQDVVPLIRTAIKDPRAYIRYNAAFVAGDLREARLRFC